MALPNHGTIRRYKAGCRCDPCKKANTDASRKYRESRAAREGKKPPRTRAPKAVPTEADVPTLTLRRRPTVPGGDALVALVDEALFDAAAGGGSAAALVAERLRASGYRRVHDRPIEAAAREALGEAGDAHLLMQHELIFRGARSLDDPENARYYASTVTAVLGILNSLTKSSGGDDEGAKAIAELMGAFGSRGRSRGRAAVDDAAESE